MNRIRTLLLTGVNNHDWKRSAYFCRDLLEASAAFSVMLTEKPSESLEDAKTAAKYQLMFVDYNGTAWTPGAQKNFEDAVQGGAGVVVLHAASNMRGWPAFEKICGLVWGKDSGHGPYHEFTVTITDKRHPITSDLEDFKIWDELYHRLENPYSISMQTLATAFSDTAMKGTGGNEPVMLAGRYGAGRIFHMVLGHVWPQGKYSNYPGEKMLTFENRRFQRALIRGCEWAAIGEVAVTKNWG